MLYTSTFGDVRYLARVFFTENLTALCVLVFSTIFNVCPLHLFDKNFGYPQRFSVFALLHCCEAKWSKKRRSTISSLLQSFG